MDTKTESGQSQRNNDEFESMKCDFIACPLRVYRDITFMEPEDVNETLRGAMVKVFFAIRHYCLRDKKFDAFHVDIQQINVIKPDSSISMPRFKQRNAHALWASAHVMSITPSQYAGAVPLTPSTPFERHSQPRLPMLEP
jgi:hypothetical protein